MEPQARLTEIERRIATACASAGRARDEVTLVAVSKLQSDAAIETLYRLGVRDFGENKVQALASRVARLGHLEEVRWHAIGPLQSNKAKDLARMMAGTGGRTPALLHTVDRISLVAALERRLDVATPLDCLIQVNIDGEPQKAGVSPEELDALADAVTASLVLELRGLMAIPRPASEAGTEALARSFEAMRQLTARLRDRIVGEPVLSLGMSGDFELAIAHGATHVRIGSALFGPRPAA